MAAEPFEVEPHVMTNKSVEFGRTGMAIEFDHAVGPSRKRTGMVAEFKCTGMAVGLSKWNGPA